MHQVTAHGECQRCGQRWTAANAMGLAAQHEAKTGHIVEVTVVYRSDRPRPKDARDAGLPFGR